MVLGETHAMGHCLPSVAALPAKTHADDTSTLSADNRLELRELLLESVQNYMELENRRSHELQKSRHCKITVPLYCGIVRTDA